MTMASDDPAPHDDLDQYRDAIDDCDKQIVALLNRRAEHARSIGELKRGSPTAGAEGSGEREGGAGDGSASGGRIFVPEREKAVYARVAAHNRGPLAAQDLRAIYREVMSACIALERPTVVAFLGPAGTFTHQCARQKFGTAMEYLPCATIRDVFHAVQRGEAQLGVAPIENSTEGSVNATSDMLLTSQLAICAESFLAVHQQLLCRGPLDEVVQVCSHPTALAQCREWLLTHLPAAQLHEVSSTAAAAARAADDPQIAAIASEAAAEVFELPIAARCIEDRLGNTTRFIIVATEGARPSGDDRTSVVFSVRDSVGCLYDALMPFRQNNVNLLRIESRPRREGAAWEYSFFVDMQGHADAPELRRAFDELAAHVTDFRLLGSYPRAERGALTR
jgi:chorismate mutase/prephenate dehydratase